MHTSSYNITQDSPEPHTPTRDKGCNIRRQFAGAVPTINSSVQLVDRQTEQKAPSRPRRKESPRKMIPFSVPDNNIKD